MRVQEAEVWCSESDERARMGLEDGDIWMPIAFDWDRIVCIKEAGPNDFLGDGKATIYLLTGQTFIINMAYKQALLLWLKS